MFGWKSRRVDVRNLRRPNRGGRRGADGHVIVAETTIASGCLPLHAQWSTVVLALRESMQASLVRLIASTVACVIFGGCAVTLDEELAFDPREALEREEPANLSINEESWLKKSTQFEHGVLASDAGPIAFTYAHRAENRPLFVYCFGRQRYRERHGWYYIWRLTRMNHGDLLLFDYPGTGDSGGDGTVRDFRAALDAVMTEAKRRLKPNQKLILWGYSLGAFVCAQGAKDAEVDALVLEAAARDASVFAKSGQPRWLAPFVRVKVAPELGAFDNAEALSGFKRPILVLAGGKDRLVRPAAAKAFVDTLRESGEDVSYYVFPEANHYRIWARKEFRPTLKKFVDEKLPGAYPPHRLTPRWVGPY